VVARILRTQKIPFTALEANFEQVDFVRKYGNKIYFGDASRLDLLHAAGADKAKNLRAGDRRRGGIAQDRTNGEDPLPASEKSTPAHVTACKLPAAGSRRDRAHA